MKTILLFCSSLLLFISPCFAGQVYHNEVMGFSLELPVGWDFTPAEKLPADLLSRLENYYHSQTVAVCQKKGDKYLAYPGIQIQVRKFQRLTDSKNYKAISSKQGEQLLLKSSRRLAEHLIINQINKFKVSGSGTKQIPGKRAAYAYHEYEHEDGRKLVAVVVKVIASRKCITLRCYDRVEGASLPFLNMVEGVINSFEYNDNIRKLVVPSKSKGVSLKDVYMWLLLGIGICIVIFLIRQWKRK